MPTWQDYRTHARRVSTRYFEEPLARSLMAVGLTPNRVTFLGLLVSAGCAYLLSQGMFVAGGGVLILAGMMDMVDGALARRGGTASPQGALLDSVVDRVAEATVFLGLLVYYLEPVSATEIVLINVSLVGSLMVSYLRARGEGLGVDCRVGIMTRPERVVALAVGLLLGQITIALAVIAVLTVFTTLHRFWHIHRELGGR